MTVSCLNSNAGPWTAAPAMVAGQQAPLNGQDSIWCDYHGYIILVVMHLFLPASLLLTEQSPRHMMTSSNGNIFRDTGPLCGEFTGHRWIPLTKASDAELWCFLWSVPQQTVELTIARLVIWDAITPIMTSLQWQQEKTTRHLFNAKNNFLSYRFTLWR